MCQIPDSPILINLTAFYPALQFGEELDRGSYGRIVRANRALYYERHGTLSRLEDFSEIVCKINDIEIDEDEIGSAHMEDYYAEEIQAVLNEAVLHALANHVMTRRGFPTVIPSLFEVLAISPKPAIQRPSDIESIVLGMEFVEGTTLHKFMADEFPVAQNEKEVARNDRLLMDVIIQLCIYLEILQHDLRFNHRDLKTNNVLRRAQPAGWNRCFQHPALSRPWIAFHDLVLIDFGFSCVACREDNTSFVQAGAWFKPEHDCLKGGRDLALFLHCLQVYFPLQKRISQGLWGTLHAAMRVQGLEGEPSLLDYGVKEDGTIDRTTAPTGYFIFSDGIYRLLRKKDVNVAGCTPATLLEALDRLRKLPS
jgi:serine/threonine protein kinase